MKSYDFVEMYKEKNNLHSDYSAAKRLGISRSAMSNYKHGRPLDEELAWKIAQDLDIDASDILVVMAAERSKSPEISKAFMSLCKLSKEGGRATANLLITIAFSAFWVQTLYIMLNSGRSNSGLRLCECSHKQFRNFSYRGVI